MSETQCTCDLVDVSDTPWEPRYVRGLSNGCKVHPPTEYEQKLLARQAEADEWEREIDKRRAAAEKAAREAP